MWLKPFMNQFVREKALFILSKQAVATREFYICEWCAWSATMFEWVAYVKVIHKSLEKTKQRITEKTLYCITVSAFLTSVVHAGAIWQSQDFGMLRSQLITQIQPSLVNSAGLTILSNHCNFDTWLTLCTPFLHLYVSPSPAIISFIMWE